MRMLGVALGLALLPGMAAALTCPATLTAHHAGFEIVGPPPAGPAGLTAGQLIDGPPGNEATPAPYLLAPDRSEQRGLGGLRNEWRAQAGLLMVCRYAGTQSYLRAVLPAGLSRCVMTRGSGRLAFACS